MHEPQLPEDRAHKVVLRTLLLATTIMVSLLFVLLVLSYSVAGNHHILGRVVSGFLVLAYIAVANLLFQRKAYRVTSFLLVGLYMLMAIVAIAEWGINVPFALLIMAITVILAGILLGPRYALWAAGALSAAMFIEELLDTMDVYNPNTNWQVGAQPKLGEAIGYSLMLAMLAVIAWLFGRQIKQSLQQAHTAEKALQAEKDMLAVRLQERTEELRAVQLQEMQQLYRFAELGQLSTAFLHDVANHLSVLTLDIEDLKRNKGAAAVDRAVDSAYQSIAYLDDLVREVRIQLHDEEHPRQFHVAQNIRTVAETLQRRFRKAKATLHIETSGNEQAMQCFGDPTRFSQIMTILINNALEATKAAKSKQDKRLVSVQVDASKQSVVVTVSDWGVGVPEADQKKIFDAFYGTKASGMGIGLFITKQIIETHFSGRLSLESPAKPTMFKITLPHRKKAHAKKRPKQN